MSQSRGIQSEFDAFVRDRHAKALEAVDQWQHDRDEWLRSLDDLYSRISGYLARYLKSGKISVEFRQTELNEDGLGSYAATSMVVKIGLQEITLNPVGTLFFGAKGRVDVKGPAGDATLLLVDADSSGPQFRVAVRVKGLHERKSHGQTPPEARWAWKIATPPPRIQYIELTPDSFFELLMEVANA
jgi:hypothetical protein